MGLTLGRSLHFWNEGGHHGYKLEIKGLKMFNCFQKMANQDSTVVIALPSSSASSLHLSSSFKLQKSKSLGFIQKSSVSIVQSSSSASSLNLSSSFKQKERLKSLSFIQKSSDYSEASGQIEQAAFSSRTSIPKKAENKITNWI